MLTPKDLLIAYLAWTQANGGVEPSQMIILKDLWDYLTKPSPLAIHPKPQPTTFIKATVVFDPTYTWDQVSFA